MISASNKIQNKKIELLSTGLDKFLSDKYILAKDIRDLNKTLQESIDTLNALEDEVKNKLNFKEQLEQYINKIDEIQTAFDFPASKKMLVNELIEKFNSEQDLKKLLETIKEKGDFTQVKQLLTEKRLTLTHEIKNLHEKIECRNNVNSEVSAERDHMKLQLKNIEEDIADFKQSEIEEK